MESLLRDLGLENHLKNKLTLKSVLKLRKLSDVVETAHSLRSLPWLFLRKLMMVSSSARIIKSASNSNRQTCEESTNIDEERKESIH